MSNPIRYDSLLVRALAAELHARFADAALQAVGFDPAERLAWVETERGTLRFDLRPTSGRIHVGSPPATGERLRVKRARMVWVGAPPDERLLRLDWRGGGDPTSLVVELMTNQWNALLLDRAGRIVRVLRARGGARPLRVGGTYAPPAGGGAREGATAALERERWQALLAEGGESGPASAGLERRLLARVAYTSPLNAGAILYGAPEGARVPPAPHSEPTPPLAGAFQRYTRVVAGADPHVLRFAHGIQPYPCALPGCGGEPAASLLDAMDAAADPGPRPLSPEAMEVCAAIDARVRRWERRRDRLLAEAAETEEPDFLREAGNLLLVHAAKIPRGAQEAVLPRFEGGERALPLDPALSAMDNARAYFDRARRAERARSRIPQLVAELDAQIAQAERWRADVSAGHMDPQSVRAHLPPSPTTTNPKKRRGGAQSTSLPYRLYRTSGGYEVRVGRNRRANDELTLHESSPGDVWLHARDEAGAHVILRWSDARNQPPAKDLHEAAVLAALHSRARTSGVVAVDWTLRKYVRKPRKAPPGAVVPDRVKTLFVEPDADLEQRMRVEEL